MEDALGLDRFLAAQAMDYDTALAELQAGRKRTHWIWYVLPQLRGLGRSSTSEQYGIASREEAEAYVAHPILGARLRACVSAILAHHPRRTAREILGTPDDLKLRSCLTLFCEVAPEEPLFAAALVAFYGAPDARTAALLGEDG